MEPLTLYQLKERIDKISKDLTTEQQKDTIIILGDDDELNGIHYGWYAEICEPSKDEDDNHLMDALGYRILDEDKNKTFILIS